MDTIQVLCRIGMSVTLIAVLLSIAAAQQTETLPPKTSSTAENSVAVEPVALGNRLGTISNLVHPFITRELPLLHDHLEQLNPVNDQHLQFLNSLLETTDVADPVPLSVGRNFTHQLIKKLSDQVAIEVTSSPDEMRLDWLRPLSEFLANLLSQLYADEKYDDAIRQLNELEKQIESLLQLWPMGDHQKINDMRSIVGYYRYRCDTAILLAKHRSWGGDSSKVTSHFMSQYPKTTGAAAAAYFAGYSLEHQPQELMGEEGQESKSADLQPADWYRRASNVAPKSIFGKAAHGSLSRLDCKGKPFSISGGLSPGVQINLNDPVYRGKSVLVVLFHIPPVSLAGGRCERMAEELSTILKPYRDRGLEVIGVICHSPTLSRWRLRNFPSTSSQFLIQAKLNFPCVIDFIDEKQSLSVAYGYPMGVTFFLLDQDKNVVRAGMPTPYDAFLDGIPESLLVAKSEETSTTQPTKKQPDKESMPDISGKWQCPLIFLTRDGDLVKTDPNRTCTIRRDDDANNAYVIEDYSPDLMEGGFAPTRLLWSPGQKQFGNLGTYPLGSDQLQGFVLETTEDRATLKAKWLVQPYATSGNLFNGTVRASVIWRRLDETNEVQYVKPSTDGKRENITVSSAEDVVRKKIDTAEAAKLRSEIEVYERRAKDLASSAARLLLKEKEVPFGIVLLSNDLKSAVRNAYVKKSQLEQLRIQEMQKRVNQLQEQHRRRSTRQTEIIDQQIRELVSHARVSLETENSDRSPDLGETDASEVSRSVQQFEENRFDRAIEVELLDSKRGSKKRVPVEVDRSKAGMEDARSKPIDTDAQFKSESSRSYNSLLTSLASGQDEIKAAEAEFNRFMKLYEQKIEPFGRVTEAKRNLDTANLKQQVLTEEYQATMRDLRLQLAAARFKWEESKELVDLNEQAFAKKQISKLDLFQARQKSRQDELAYQRIEVQLELFQKLNAFLQLTSPLKPPNASVQSTGNTQTVCWGMLLESVRKQELNEVVKGTKFREAMRIVKIDPNSPAGKAGITEGDFLVGLGDWETANADNVVWIQRRLEKWILDGEKPDVKFVIVRGGEQVHGTIEIANPIRR